MSHHSSSMKRDHRAARGSRGDVDTGGASSSAYRRPADSAGTTSSAVPAAAVSAVATATRSVRQHPVVLGLDVGGVLSKLHAEDAHLAPWLSAMPGAFPFLILFGVTHGYDNLWVISRTNTGTWFTKESAKSANPVEHWVVRFLRQLGLFKLGVPEDQVLFCTARSGRFGKGPLAAAARLTHFVDDRPSCLKSVLTDPCGNAGESIRRHGFQILFLGPGVTLSEHEAKVLEELDSCHRRDKCSIAHDFKHIASELDLAFWNDTGLWDWLSDQGPPKRWCENPLGVYKHVLGLARKNLRYL